MGQYGTVLLLNIPRASESNSVHLYSRFGVFVQFYDGAFKEGGGRKEGNREGPKSWGASKGIWLAVIAVVVTAPPLVESVVNGYS